MNGLLITDNHLHELLREHLSPANGVLDLQIPKKIAKILNLPKPTTSTIVHWFNEQILERKSA